MDTYGRDSGAISGTANQWMDPVNPESAMDYGTDGVGNYMAWISGYSVYNSDGQYVNEGAGVAFENVNGWECRSAMGSLLTPRSPTQERHTYARSSGLQRRQLSEGGTRLYVTFARYNIDIVERVTSRVTPMSRFTPMVDRGFIVSGLVIQADLEVLGLDIDADVEYEDLYCDDDETFVVSNQGGPALVTGTFIPSNELIASIIGCLRRNELLVASACAGDSVQLEGRWRYERNLEVASQFGEVEGIGGEL